MTVREECGANARSIPGGFPYICNLPKGHPPEEHGRRKPDYGAALRKGIAAAKERELNPPLCHRSFQRCADEKTVTCILPEDHWPTTAHAFAKDE